ncbi:MAG: hypothetical protein RSC06_06305 [Clostridia bacterium]
MSDTEPFAYGTQATTRQLHRRFQRFRKPRGAIGSAQKAAYPLRKRRFPDLGRRMAQPVKRGKSGAKKGDPP